MTDDFMVLSKELNITEKRMFRAALLKALNEKKKDFFKSCVDMIGKAWHVSRSVKQTPLPILSTT